MARVTRLKYVITQFDFTLYKGVLWRIIEIFPDGGIIIKTFAPGSRKVQEKREYMSSPEEFVNLCVSLRTCIDNGDEEIMGHIVDDTDATLTINYSDGRAEIVPREVGNGDTYVHAIIWDFVLRYDELYQKTGKIL